MSSADDDFFTADILDGEIDIEATIVKVGEEIDLTKIDQSMTEIMIGLGWDLRPFDAEPMDLDVSCFLLNADGKTRENSDFIFYNAMKGCDGAVIHNGDSRTGAGDGDDESISIDLRGLPFDIVKVVFALTIHDGVERGQALSGVRGGFLRIIDRRNSHEIARYILDEELEGRLETGMIVASIERNGPNWVFKALGESVNGGLAEIAQNYAIIIAEANG